MSLSIYGLALVAMFTCSAGYNLIVRPKVKAVFRRLDHAAIFLMIAGTYTPFALMKMDAEWGYTLLAVVWTMAAIGIAIKLFAPRYLRRRHHRALSGAGLGGDRCLASFGVGRAGDGLRSCSCLAACSTPSAWCSISGSGFLPECHLARFRAGRRELFITPP